MREYIDFYYNGVSSMAMGIINVNVKGGLFEESFISSRNINETKVRGNEKPYFANIEREPLQFDLEFAFENPYDKDLIAEVAMWLDQQYYRELYFTDNPDRRFFCMMISDSSLVHNGFGQGYISVKMRCDSAYSYSQEYLSQEIDFAVNTTNGTDYSFMNIGHVDLKPEMWIYKIGDGDISITNKASGRLFQFTGLNAGETVYINNESGHIESDIIGLFRYDSFNDEYLYFEKGRNIISVKGNCKLQFRYRFKTIQG
jgi:phage-related protein